MGTEGVLFGNDGSELAIEGAKDLSILSVKDDDWWDLPLEFEGSPAMSPLPLDCCWWRWLLMGALARLSVITDLV